MLSWSLSSEPIQHLVRSEHFLFCSNPVQSTQGQPEVGCEASVRGNGQTHNKPAEHAGPPLGKNRITRGLYNVNETKLLSLLDLSQLDDSHYLHE